MKALWTSALALLLAATLAGTNATAQDDDAELAQRRDQKLAEPWLKAAPWITDYQTALEASKKSGKPIFAYFTRSYSP